MNLAMIAVALLGSQAALAQSEYMIPLFLADGHPVREGFARIINHSTDAGTVSIVAIDDSGNRSETITLTLGPRSAAQFNSGDLEAGNPSKGLSGRAGDGDGDWRLELTTELDIEPLAYVRTEGGFVTSMHEIGPTGHYLPIFNPGSNHNQQSRVRVINPNADEVGLTIFGRDDDGSLIAESESYRAVSFRLSAGAARTIDADALEAGDEDLEGALGDGAGKWRLFLVAELPVLAMSLLESPNGNLTNLSTVPSYRERAVPLFLSASDPGRQGFVRIVNTEDAYGTVDVHAFDDSGVSRAPVTLALGPWESLHFNSTDLEEGAPGKGITQGIGGGEGHWRLQLSSGLAIQVTAYVRTDEGFVTAMHDVGQEVQSRHYLPFFNPASNTAQRSLLRLVNPADRDTEVVVSGIDDSGTESSGKIRLTLPGHASQTFSAQDLESGGNGLLHGMLGDGKGKWRLEISADGPVFAMSLLDSANGRLTNLSRTFHGGFEPPTNSYKITGEEAFNAAGRGVASAGDMDGDGVPDLIVGAVGTDRDPNFEDFAGSVYLLSGASLPQADAADGVADGRIELSVARTQRGSWKLIGEAGGDGAGRAATSVGDVDGDGRSDLAVGADGQDAGGENAGAAYLVASSGVSGADADDGRTDGVVALGNVAAQHGSYKLVGESDYDRAGASLSAAGDIDGDGVADFLIGAIGPDPDDEVDLRPGAVYVVSGASLAAADRDDGQADGVVGLANLAMRNGSWKLVGEQDYDQAGTSVAADDIDGDGLPELVVGAPGYSEESENCTGAVYVVSTKALPSADMADGSTDGVVSLGRIAAEPGSWKLVCSEDAEDQRVGLSVASAGDIDGDGLADLVIGQWAILYPESVYLVAAASLTALDEADDKADGIIDLGKAGDWDGSWKLLAEKVVYGLDRDYWPTGAGFSVATAGDVDGDGLSDFLVGTNNGGRPLDQVEEWVTRAAFLISGGDLAELNDEYGSERNEINLDAHRFQAVSSWQFVGEGEDNAGISVAPAGDVDGDGLADLYIGANRAGDQDRGAVYLVSAADLPALDRADGFADGYILLGEISVMRD